MRVCLCMCSSVSVCVCACEREGENVLAGWWDTWLVSVSKGETSLR